MIALYGNAIKTSWFLCEIKRRMRCLGYTKYLLNALFWSRLIIAQSNLPLSIKYRFSILHFFHDEKEALYRKMQPPSIESDVVIF
jgi:hypothetical protein